MFRQNSWNLVSLTVLLCSCHSEPGHLRSSLDSPGSVSAETSRDGGPSSEGESDKLHDGAVPSSAIDAAVSKPGIAPRGSRDAAAELPPKDPRSDVADSDAGAEPSTRDGGTVARQPRADGCPQDAPLPIDA